MQYHVSIISPDSQETILDEEKFTNKKKSADDLAAAYDYIGSLWSESAVSTVDGERFNGDAAMLSDSGFWHARAAAVRNCGSFLEFVLLPTGERRLKSMYSCKDRLCPMCAWRRSLKTYSNVRAILEDPDCAELVPLFATLTIKNCDALDLCDCIDDLLQGFRRLSNDKAFKAAYKGWMRTLEITHNVSANTYHPHIHMLLLVRKSYFTSRYYLSQSRLTEMWQRCCRLSYVPIVHLERCYSMGGAVAEVAKYATKDADYIIIDNPDLTAEAIQSIFSALRARRLVAYGGIMRRVRAKLALDDEDSGDLSNVSPDELVPPDDAQSEVYFWHSGYRAYVRCDRKNTIISAKNDSK